MEAELQRLKGLGFKQLGKVCASEIYGYEAAGVFLFSRGAGLVELVQERKTDE